MLLMSYDPFNILPNSVAIILLRDFVFKFIDCKFTCLWSPSVNGVSMILASYKELGVQGWFNIGKSVSAMHLINRMRITSSSIDADKSTVGKTVYH